MTRWIGITLCLLMACGDESANTAGSVSPDTVDLSSPSIPSSPRATSPSPATDACALVNVESVERALGVSGWVATRTVNPAQGGFASACELRGEGGFLHLTLQEDPDGSVLRTLERAGAPFVEPVEGLGRTAFRRMDGSLLWSGQDGLVYGLSGHRASASEGWDVEVLKILARELIAR